MHLNAARTRLLASRSGLALITWLLLVPLAQAQPAAELTIDLIDQRLSRLSESGGTNETAQTDYEQARTFLAEQRAHEREAQAYVDSLTEAAAQRDAIQSRLDASVQAADPAAELTGLSEDELKTRLALARSELNELDNRLEAADRTLATREVNTASIQARLQEIDARLAELPTTEPVVQPESPPSAVEASQWLTMAEARALVAERRALEARLASQPVRFSALTAVRAELAMQLQQARTLVAALESSLSNIVEQDYDLDDLGIDPGDPVYPIAADITDELSRLGRERGSLNTQQQEINAQNQRIEILLRLVDDRYATARRLVEFAADSDAVGPVLLTYWQELNDLSLADPTARVPQMAGDLVIRRVQREEKLSKMLSGSAYLNSRLSDAGIDPDSIGESLRQKLLDLIRTYRENLRDIISVESELLNSLERLDSSFTNLQQKTTNYRDYLESLLLWIPNHPPLWNLSIKAINADFAHIQSRLEAISHAPGLNSALVLLAAVALFLVRPRIKIRQQALNDRIARPRDDSIRHTLIAMIYAAVRAAPIPLLIYALATGFDPLHSAENASMRRLLWIFPTLLFTFQLTQIICEPGGIGKVHFKWPVDVVERVYDELRLLTIWWLPLLLAAAIAHNLAPQTGSEALGRLLLLLVLLVLGYHLGAPQVRELRNVGTVWFRSTLNRLRMLLSGVLLLALYAILVGQVFSVTVVIGVLINTFWIGVFLLLVNSILLRWLRVARRHLRLSELLAQRSEQGEEETASVEEKVPDLVEVSTETQQLITFASIVTAALSLFYVWAPLLPALEGLNRVTLWTSSSVVDGETITNSITATTLIVVLALGMFTLFAAQRLPALVEIVLRSRTSVTPGARYTVSTLLNYVIIGAGLIAGLSALGLKWGQLQWLVAALGVGIGFGLQEIVANFISGLIILFERPIRVGDIVTIGDKDGRVVRIRIRATTIRDWEGKELLVPNKEFITGRLLNWTLSDSQNRLEIPVGIAYGSDVDKALQILETTVRENPSVLSDPAPSILFLGFGDNSLNLSARVFISKIDERMPILSELHKAINSAFNEAGIVIAFPQRDVHFDADKPLRIAMEPRSEPGS